MNFDDVGGDFIHLLKMLTNNNKKRRLDFVYYPGLQRR